MNSNLYEKLLERVTIPVFTSYMGKYGWRIFDQNPNKNLLVLKKEFNPADIAEIVIPSKESFKDYKMRLNDVLKTISIYEEKPVDMIIKEMAKPNIDILEQRIISDESNDGTLPLVYASSLIEGLKNLVISTACTEDNPRPYYQVPTKKAINYADSFRFGQTDIGSFVVTIETDPLPEPTIQMQIVDENTYSECVNVPFQRKVMKRIQKALYQIETIGSNGSIDSFIETAYEDGINANMCEAIIQMNAADKPIKIESKFNWSSIYPVCDELPDIMSITHNSFYFVNAIKEAYKSKKVVEKVRIEGKIAGLKVKDNIMTYANDLSGYITIECIIDGRQRTVKVYLEGLDYQIACDAHKNKKLVCVDGILDRSSKFWFLDEPSNFTVL